MLVTTRVRERVEEKQRETGRDEKGRSGAEVGPSCLLSVRFVLSSLRLLISFSSRVDVWNAQ